MATFTKTIGSYSVNDVEVARAFYTQTLGLEVEAMGERGPLWLHGTNGHVTMLYGKPDHEPATFTVLNLLVDDIEVAVDDLAGRGVEFLRYDGIDADDRGIARNPGRAVAWFSDPAGNCLSVAQLEM